MRVAMILIAAALPLVGCTGERDFGPLNGSWGGESFEVSATPSKIAITLTCGANVQIAHGILVDGD